MNKPVSVIINTYDRAFCIGNTLDALLQLDYDNFEVIVVNGPSKDKTAEVLDLYSENIRIENCPEKNLSISRNIGVCAAAGEIVVFIDDDGIPEPEWLNRLLTAYEDPNVGGAGGFAFDDSGYKYQTQYVVSDRIGRSEVYSEFPKAELLNFPHSRRFPGVIGVNSSFRRDRLIEVGGFDEFFVYHLDETDVCLRLVDAGYKIVCVPDAYVHHKGAPSEVRNLHMIARSQAYFAIVNSKNTHTDDEVKAGIFGEIEKYKAEVKDIFDKGLIDASNRDERLTLIDQYSAAGISAANSLTSRDFINKDKANSIDKNSFKRVNTCKPDSEKMVICLISKEYAAPQSDENSRWTKEVASSLASIGHKVHVICRSDIGNTVDFKEGVWIHKMAPLKPEINTLPEGIKLPEMHEAHAYAVWQEVKRINTHHKVNIVSAPLYDLEGVYCVLDESLPTITSIHSNFKSVLESHPEYPKWKLNPAFPNSDLMQVVNGEKWLLSQAKKLLSNSQISKGALELDQGVSFSNANLAIIPLGIKDVSSDYNIQRSDQRIKILFTGNLEPRRGIKELLDCIPNLCEQFPEVDFILAGDVALPSENGQTYHQIFHTLHQSKPWFNRVIFTGKLDDETLAQAYAGCDIFVAPAHFESFGLNILEAMMFSKPIIACKSGVAPEIIEDQVSGLLAEPESAQSLLDCLTKLVSNTSLRDQMGQAARERFLANFTAEIMTSKLFEYYAKLSGKSDKPKFEFKPNLDAASLLT